MPTVLISTKKHTSICSDGIDGQLNLVAIKRKGTMFSTTIHTTLAKFKNNLHRGLDSVAKTKQKVFLAERCRPKIRLNVIISKRNIHTPYVKCVCNMKVP